MITLEEFRKAEKNLQSHLLWSDGIFLMVHKKGKVTRELFALYDFYVEIVDYPGGLQKYIDAFAELKYLKPYLQMITIDDIFEQS
jgi:hypothetical protein